MIKVTAQFVYSNPVYCLAFGFGSGLSPKAPGTIGTLAALPFWFLIAPLPLFWQMLVIIAAFFIGITLCDKTSKALNVHDHGGIVWDEFVGVWITLLFAPFTPLGVLLSFVLFRFFDVVKPWPIKWLDKKVHGGFGIMIDDVVAGLMAGVVIWLII